MRFHHFFLCWDTKILNRKKIWNVNQLFLISKFFFIFYFTFCNYSSTFTLTDFFWGKSIAIETKVNNCHFRLNQQIVHRPALERKTFGFIWILNLVSQFCFIYFFSFNACSLFCICSSLACDAWRLKKIILF